MKAADFENTFKLILKSGVLDIKSKNMILKKITLACILLLTAGTFQACNGSHDKAGMDTQSGQQAPSSSTSGNDTSHTTSRVRETIGGVKAQPEGAAPKSANGSTTAQGMVGADSVYLKNSQKSQH